MNNFDQISKEALNLASDLSGKMEQLMKLQQKTIEQLPETERAKLSFVAKDINAITKAVKNGDLSALNKLVEKYADNSNK